MKQWKTKISKLFYKTSFYVVLAILFLVVLPFTFYLTKLYTDITNIWFLMMIYPIFFFLFTFCFCAFKYQRWDIPIQLLILLMFSLVFTSNSYNGIQLFLSILFGYIGYFLAKILRNKHKIKKEEKYKEVKQFYSVIPAIFPLVLLCILEIYYRSCTFSNIFNDISILAFLFMIFLTYILYGLLVGLFKNTWRAGLVLSILFFIIFFVNQMRIFYTGDTFVFNDLLFLQTTGEMVNFVDTTFINGLKYLFTPTIIALLILAWYLSFMYHFCYTPSFPKRRVIGIASLLLLFLFLVPMESFDKFLLKTIYDTSNPEDYDIAVSNTRYYYKFGVVGGFYGKYLESFRYEPDGYDEEELDTILTNAKADVSKKWKKPNVIVVFSESFLDINRISDHIMFKEDVIPNFTRLKEEGKLFEMISPSYGGVSSNVEFEILTGGSLNYFSKGYIPYMQLYHGEKSKNNPTAIKEFQANGYQTKILNAAGSEMFQCKNVYNMMGVDVQRHLYDEYKEKEYLPDEKLFSIAISDFEQKEKDEKLFYFIITMGGHMPYYKDRYDTYDVEIEKSTEDSDINDAVLAYAEGIHLADEQLGRLYDYINTLDEETIILFFGDHLPLLQTEMGRDALSEIYFDNANTLEGIYKKYNTQALILSNYEIEHEDYDVISPDLLLTYVMNHIDMNVSPYYQFLYQTIPTLPSSNYVISKDLDGNLFLTKGLTGKMKETYLLREKMQYKLFK